MYFRTEGVVLKKRNFGEADRILTLFTRDYGKVVAIGKGVRRPRSKKAGHLELGNWCKVFIARGKSLDIITEVELKRAFGIDEFREEKANKIYHLLELVDALTAEHQKNPQVFILLVQYLKKCSDEDDFNLVSSVFKIKLMSQLGFFSASAFKNSKTKRVLGFLENEEFEKIKEKINPPQDSLGPQSRLPARVLATKGVYRGTRTASSTYSKNSRGYLKLLTFLDSMIENITQSKLRTSKFLDGTI